MFLLPFLDHNWRFVVSATVAQSSWLHRLIMQNGRTFQIDPTSPYAAKHMAHHLQSGGRLVLFAEGRITNTGNLMKLFDGTGFLLHKTPARIITCYLRGADRLQLSRNPGWRRWFPKVTAHFSAILHHADLAHVRPMVARKLHTEWLRTKMVEQKFEVEMSFGPSNIPEAICETARRQPDFEVLEDIEQKPLSYRRLLVGADALASVLEQTLPAAASVGVLLPNLNATPLTLLALWFSGRVPAVLNFSSGVPMMLTCAELAEVGAVVTSRVFLEKARLDLAAFESAGIRVLYLEDLKKRIHKGRQLWSALRERFLPGALMRRRLSRESPAVVLFTSGSEGVPKGVQLSHGNVLSNIRQMLTVTDINDTDRIFNALPIFHSFGLAVGTLLGLVRGSYVFLYPSPLHYRIIPNVIYDKNCTVFLSTNTFLNGYNRRSHPYDFHTVRYLFAAAEKVQETTFTTWAQQYGVRILEGYGATECSPALSANVPLACKHGSAGRFLPGVEWRLEPVEGVQEGGRLLVRGPNIMLGYLKKGAPQPVAPAEGWYDTGDIVRIDPEGYVFILGRLKRFAKVSGEMVSLSAVEDALAGAFPQYGRNCMVAVVARPDPDKGEMLIAITNAPQLTRREMREAIRARGLTNLCVPAETRLASHIPVLGTGKINHRELQKLLSEGALPLSQADSRPTATTADPSAMPVASATPATATQPPAAP
jgi:acyl-[acyl-carrier-protein]-phospholipid O-acyltransferase/long-chain-fatty-acid--[acyl-carrier-protein] ligase